MTDAREPRVPEPLRRRLDDVFGDVLPDVTRDEAAEPDATEADGAGSGVTGQAGGSGAQDADGPAASRDVWLRANRPPHHDRD